MGSVLQSAQKLFANFAAEASLVFSSYDSNIIQRKKKNSSNIGAKYVCQFTIELLTRQTGGFRGTADRLAEALGQNANLTYSASSICEARKKFPAQLFLDLNEALLNQISSKESRSGRRLFAIDGSKIVLPKQLEKAGFKTERKESHYPMGRLSCLYDVQSQLIHDVSLNNHCDERKAALAHFKSLKPGDITIYDRGYFCFFLLAAHRKASHDYIMRFSKSTGIKELEEFIVDNQSKKSTERTVTILPTGPNSKRRLAKEFPSESQEFSVRLIKYTYDSKPFYLLTSLQNRKEFPRKDFADLYHSRWGVEEAYKQIKVFLLRKEFHSSCYQTVCHEVFAAVLVTNMSRVLTLAVENEKKELKKNSKSSIEFGKERSSQETKLASKQIVRLFDDVRNSDIAI
jgi:hypothetical protein